jgi:hypothetical protein
MIIAAPSAHTGIPWTGIVILLAIFYFVPTIIALSRSLPNAGSVVVVNILLGWTFLGWVAALAMAAGSGRKR